MKTAMAGLFIVLAVAATPALGRARSHHANMTTTYDSSDWHNWPPSRANDIPWAPF